MASYRPTKEVVERLEGIASARELRERSSREDIRFLLCSLSLPGLMLLTAVSPVFKNAPVISR